MKPDDDDDDDGCDMAWRMEMAVAVS